MTDEQLRLLLRLKRHEQPPEGYYEELLTNIHRRQREELLQKPLWKISLERFQTFFSEHSMGALSYSGAMAGLLVVGVSTIGLLTRPSTPSTSIAAVPTLTSATQLAQLAATPTPAAPLSAQDRLSLQSSPENLARWVQAPDLLVPARASRSAAPRYVIDARPASYEPTFNF